MNRAVKAVLIAVVAVAVIIVLFTVVFPWVDRMLADPTLGFSAALG
ncbi:MAG TPA: hypothetical protein VM287_09280 [Egibacteraceae bacterium]|nr:hypothetical protein [Egibacteraceae bacterium]